MLFTTVLVLTLGSGFILSACGAKDACLDAGGHYNEETKTCEH
ncbi:hypothetical protein [Moraxella macacae]|nr:hypothetical protein [Moraxella macacae]